MLNQAFSPLTNKGKAIAQLQGLVTAVIAGEAADTTLAVPGVLATDHVESVFGFDQDAASAANSLSDFTGTAVVTAAQGTAQDLEGATLGSGSEVSIAVTGHGFLPGDEVVFADVTGTVELNGVHYVVLAATDADNFTLTGTDGDDFTAWDDAGTVVGVNVGRLTNTADTSDFMLAVRILR